MKLAREKFPDVTTFYFPIDFSWAVARALRRIRPALLVLTELELWPNLLAAASRRDVPVAVINGRLSERSARNYGKAARLVRPMFSSLAAVVTQDEDYAARFIALGTAPHRVHVVGSLKFDNAVREAAIIRDQRNEELQQLRKLIDLRAGDRLFVAGSTQEPEEAMAGRVYQALAGQFPDARLRLVVVPRHPHRAAEVQRRMEQTGIRAVLKTEPGAWPATSPDGIPAVLIVNTIGELGMWWSLADVAFVGGSFGNRGGQNMLEPAAAGCASCFGPNTWNFARIAADMKAVAAAIEVTNEEELRMFVERCLDDDDYFRRLTQLGRQFVEFRCGATDRYVAHLSRLLTRRIAANKRSAA